MIDKDDLIEWYQNEVFEADDTIIALRAALTDIVNLHLPAGSGANQCMTCGVSNCGTLAIAKGALLGDCTSISPSKGYPCSQPLEHEGRHSSINGYVW